MSIFKKLYELLSEMGLMFSSSFTSQKRFYINRFSFYENDG